MKTNQPMSEAQQELMSKLMDGEISELELHRLLKDCEQNDDMRAYWSELNLVQSANNFDDVEIVTGTSFADSVRAKIDGAQEEVATEQLTSKSWWRPVSQFAVAASVAALMVAVAPLVNLNSTNDAGEFAAFQSDDETIYDLNAVLALQTPQNQQVSVQNGYVGSNLNQADRKLMSTLDQGAFVAEPKSPEEQQRIARLMSEYMILHANSAGLNSPSSVQNYLQVAPKQ